MAFEVRKILFVYFLGILVACSDSTQVKDVEQPKPAFVTNAEYALESIELKKASIIAFHVKPKTSAACKHMYIEFGQKNADGNWDTTNIMYPGKDPRNNFGQQNIQNQIHFAEVDGVGEYGIVALGCKPYGEELKIYRELLAKFEVESGRLNYIGEAVLLPVRTDFATVHVVNRAEFAKEQIREQLPKLEQAFQEQIMERYIPELSKEQQEIINAIEARNKAMQPLLDMRNEVAREYNLVVDERNKWMELYGGRSNENKTAEAERQFDQIFHKKEALEAKLELHDTFIDERRSLKYVKRYMFLLNDIEKKKAKYNAASGNARTDFMVEMLVAQSELKDFRDNNPKK